MEESDEDGNPFAIPDLWKPSLFDPSQIETGSLQTEGCDALSYGINLDHEFRSEGDTLFKSSHCLGLALPDLSNFEYGPLEILGTAESSLAESTDDSTEDAESVEEDPWTDVNLLIQSDRLSGFKSWEIFHNKAFKERRTAYFSDGGPLAFDAALRLHPHGTDHSPNKRNGRVVKSHPMLRGLVLLGLGRDSQLFRYIESEKTFRPYIEDGRMSGYTPQSIASLTANFIGYGDKTRGIRQFVNEVYSSSNSCPTLISLVNAFSTVLSTFESQFGDLSISSYGVLQLQSLFHGPGLILSGLSDIIAKIGEGHYDEEVLSKLYKFVQDFEHTNTWLRLVMFEILARGSKPWLESVGKWLGLNKELAFGGQGQCHNFVTTRKESRKGDGGKEFHHVQYDFHPGLMPCFIGDEDAAVIFETGRALRLLQVHTPDHPLVNSQTLNPAENLALDWRFSWQDVEIIQLKATLYQSRLVEAIISFHNSEVLHETSNVDAEVSVQSDGGDSASRDAPHPQIAESITEIPILDEIPKDLDFLSQTVMKCSTASNATAEAENASFAPPLSLVPLLSFNPIITTQALLVNQACLRLLFKEHKLRLHLSLQHRYNLFGDGVFTSRLSHALFDPDLQSAERRKGHSRSGVSGLKLGSRDTWPPASSELRLALMGILNESYFHAEPSQAAASFRIELPGGLSFAIRDMAEDEFQQCLDPDSIGALDFLRLQYRPPSPVDAVITPSCMEKYDLIFKLLLRGTRMLFVVNQLFRDPTDRFTRSRRTGIISRRFKLEAHHFVSAICTYFFDGVKSNWRVFSQKLDHIEKRLDEYESGEQEGVHDLRDFHEEVLDRLMFALLLRHRQAQVMKLLEEIFSSILLFARHSLREAAATGAETDAKVESLYERFRKKVKVFVNVCRGLSERRGPGGGPSRYDHDHDHGGAFDKEDIGESRGNTLGQLLLKLEMSGYYTKSNQ